MKIRKPAVSGKFYPDKADAIDHQLSQILKKENPYIDPAPYGSTVIGGVVPHAGYMFSGYEAVHFFETLRHAANKPKTFIIVNPNHTGYGPGIALDDHQFWNTPYGNVALDQQLAAKLPFPASIEAHRFEHAAEVMVPMLHYFLDYPFQILPITLSKQTPENARYIAEELAKAIAGNETDYCMIASSDFSHYLPAETGKQADWPVIVRILDKDARGVYDQVRGEHLSICGYGPIMTLIYFSQIISQVAKIKLLRFGHSGEVVPSNDVVDYASILFYNE